MSDDDDIVTMQYNTIQYNIRLLGLDRMLGNVTCEITISEFLQFLCLIGVIVTLLLK